MFAEAAAGAALLAACEGRDGWNEQAPPVQIVGNSYYVGTCGISAILITSARGHILIDGGTEQGAALIAGNVERLGFRLRDVKWIVVSHEHHDHVGGLAELQRRTRARVAVRRGSAPLFRTGRNGPDDPQFGELKDFPPVRVDRELGPGDEIRLGSLRITALPATGHAPFGTSWRWQTFDAATCRTLVYADSVSAIPADGYRFSDHPALVQGFRDSMARLAASPCEVLITPHPQASRLFERVAGREPLVEPQACKAYAAKGLANLDARLAREAK